MSFVEMLTASQPAATTAVTARDSPWTAVAATPWTSEEISIIQELFLPAGADAKDAALAEKSIQISDISIKSEDDPMSATQSAPTADATSMLLSPIGADDGGFLQRFLMDEKDAMAAFFTEAIDPFQHVTIPPSSANKRLEKPSTALPAVAAPGLSEGRPLEQVLAKLRAKVDALNRIYYSRCMNMSDDASAATIKKMKLMLALEKLQRVVQGLSKENARLNKETTSCEQRSSLLLEDCNDSQSWLETLGDTVDEAVCAAAVREGVDAALKCSQEGEVLKDSQDGNGWVYKSSATDAGVFTYTLRKEYPESANMLGAMQKTWTNVSSSEKFSCLYYGSIKAQVVKKVGKETVIMYDATNHDSTRVDRVLAVLFRVKLENGFLLGARSINSSAVAAAAASTSESEDKSNVRWMDCTTWQHYECQKGGGFSVVSGGQLAYPSRADIDFMAVEILCMHLRWEMQAIGCTLSM